jgi:hypothetical protein
MYARDVRPALVWVEGVHVQYHDTNLQLHGVLLFWTDARRSSLALSHWHTGASSPASRTASATAAGIGSSSMQIEAD